MAGQEFDRYFDKVMPLVAIIAMMKTFLAEEIAKKAIAQIEKSNRCQLTEDEKEAVQSAADAAIANMNPDVFKLDLTWSPKSSEEIKDKLIELKLDKEFKAKLAADVIRVFREPQARLHEYR